MTRTGHDTDVHCQKRATSTALGTGLLAPFACLGICHNHDWVASQTTAMACRCRIGRRGDGSFRGPSGLSSPSSASSSQVFRGPTCWLLPPSGHFLRCSSGGCICGSGICGGGINRFPRAASSSHRKNNHSTRSQTGQRDPGEWPMRTKVVGPRGPTRRDERCVMERWRLRDATANQHSVPRCSRSLD